MTGTDRAKLIEGAKRFLGEPTYDAEAELLKACTFIRRFIEDAALRADEGWRPIAEAPTHEEGLYAKARALVVLDQKPSTSYVQRRLQINYNTATALMDRMEREGIVTAAVHGKREMIQPPEPEA